MQDTTVGLVRRLRQVIGGLGLPPVTDRCGVCGCAEPFSLQPVIDLELTTTWQLDALWLQRFNEREGSACKRCRASQRVSWLGKGIVRAANLRSRGRANYLSDIFVTDAGRALDIAEINHTQQAHVWLSRSPRLRYSEYGSVREGVPSEDLMHLSYPDSSFDIVITSDTLEHVPDIDRALCETRRILKPGGFHVFTVPLIGDRPTRQRARQSATGVEHLLPPSFHGSSKDEKGDLLVFYEFGNDFVARCEQAGFEVQVLQDARNPSLSVFLAQRPLRS